MPIDYSRFDHIDVSDDEDEQAYKARKAAEEAGRRASKAQAKECVEAWWQACPKQSQFSVECAARLTRAGTTSLYNNTSGPLKGLGLGFAFSFLDPQVRLALGLGPGLGDGLS